MTRLAAIAVSLWATVVQAQAPVPPESLDWPALQARKTPAAEALANLGMDGELWGALHQRARAGLLSRPDAASLASARQALGGARALRPLSPLAPGDPRLPALRVWLDDSLILPLLSRPAQTAPAAPPRPAIGERAQKMYDPKTGTLLGEKSLDGTRGWRIDSDHVNWWDWSGGAKGTGGRYGHDWFPESQSGPHSLYRGYAP